MRHVSLETKEAIVKQALEKNGKILSEIAAVNNIGYSTLQKWLCAIREGRPLSRINSSRPAQEMNKADQLNHLLATANLDESEIGPYCRKHGIYSHQLTTWKEVFMSESE